MPRRSFVVGHDERGPRGTRKTLLQEGIDESCSVQVIVRELGDAFSRQALISTQDKVVGSLVLHKNTWPPSLQRRDKGMCKHLSTHI